VFFQKSKLKNGSIFVFVIQISSIGPLSLYTEKHAKSMPGRPKLRANLLAELHQTLDSNKMYHNAKCCQMVLNSLSAFQSFPAP
jgi:hypothetical protein